MNVRVPICMQTEIKEHLCLLSAELQEYTSVLTLQNNFSTSWHKKAQNLFQNTYANSKVWNVSLKLKVLEEFYNNYPISYNWELLPFLFTPKRNQIYSFIQLKNISMNKYFFLQSYDITFSLLCPRQSGRCSVIIRIAYPPLKFKTSECLFSTEQDQDQDCRLGITGRQSKMKPRRDL